MTNRKPNCSCAVCGTEIYRRPKDKRENNFCSLKCYGIFNRVVKICPICGKEFWNNSKTCSRSCGNKSRTGITYDGLRKNSNFENGRKAKKFIAERDGGLCIKCGNDNWNILQTHHVLSKKNGGSNDYDNLILICPNCHMIEHLGYGKWK